MWRAFAGGGGFGGLGVLDSCKTFLVAAFFFQESVRVMYSYLWFSFPIWFSFVFFFFERKIVVCSAGVGSEDTAICMHRGGGERGCNGGCGEPKSSSS
jgi:hypothetical protein